MKQQSFLVRVSGALLLTLAASCGRAGGDVTEAGDEGQAPPPAAALAREAAIGLETRLEGLEANLAAVLESDLDDDTEANLLAAEAVTDRLLEDEPSTEWLPSGYFVEARLRQIQALADRIVAELRRGVARELILEDIAALHMSVRDLRTRLASARTTAPPPPLDSLLAGYEDDRSAPDGGPAGASSSASSDTTSATPAPQPAPARDDGPLGEPISP